MGWVYLHLPLTISITAVGAATLNMVEHAGEGLSGDVRWLLTGAITVALITIALLLQTIQHSDEHRQILRLGSVVTLVAGLLIGALGFSALEPIRLLIVMVLLMLAPIFFGLWLWIKQTAAGSFVTDIKPA